MKSTSTAEVFSSPSDPLVPLTQMLGVPDVAHMVKTSSEENFVESSDLSQKFSQGKTYQSLIDRIKDHTKTQLEDQTEEQQSNQSSSQDSAEGDNSSANSSSADSSSQPKSPAAARPSTSGHLLNDRKLQIWSTWLRNTFHRPTPFLLFWSAIVGICAGFVVAAFRLVVRFDMYWLYRLYAYIWKGHWWVFAIIVPLSLVISIVVAHMIKEAPMIARSGVSDLEHRTRSDMPVYWHWWKVLWRKFVGGILAFAPGIYLGVEGPSVQLGACVGLGCSYAAQSKEKERVQFVVAGMAAGLSAAFTAPLAATLFILEGDYTQKDHFKYAPATIASAFTAAIFAGISTVILLGDGLDFLIPRPQNISYEMYWQFVPVGLLLGVMVWIYKKTLVWGSNIYGQLHIPTWIRAFIPFMIVIPIALYLPTTLGDGSELLFQVTHKLEWSIWILLGFLVLRLVFGQLSYGCGVPGGIFLPILALGGIFGVLSAHCYIALGLAPLDFQYISIMALSCMAGMFGGTIRKPITAVVLAVEVTRYSSMEAMGIVTLLSFLVASLIDYVENKCDQTLTRKRAAKKEHAVLRAASMGAHVDQEQGMMAQIFKEIPALIEESGAGIFSHGYTAKTRKEKQEARKLRAEAKKIAAEQRCMYRQVKKLRKEERKTNRESFLQEIRKIERKLAHKYSQENNENGDDQNLSHDQNLPYEKSSHEKLSQGIKAFEGHSFVNNSDKNPSDKNPSDGNDSSDDNDFSAGILCNDTSCPSHEMDDSSMSNLSGGDSSHENMSSDITAHMPVGILINTMNGILSEESHCEGTHSSQDNGESEVNNVLEDALSGPKDDTAGDLTGDVSKNSVSGNSISGNLISKNSIKGEKKLKDTKNRENATRENAKDIKKIAVLKKSSPTETEDTSKPQNEKSS